MTIEKTDEIAKKLNEFEQDYSRLDWAKYTTGYDFGVEEAYNKIINELCSEENFEVIEKWYNSTSLNERDKRKSEILYKKFEPFHLSKEVNELSLEIEKLTNNLSMILNTHRSQINGEDVSSIDIAQILRSEDNREKRKQAYFARTQVNKPLVDGGFVELIKLRKEYAKKRGFNDFVEMRLSDDDLTPDIFEGWKEQLRDKVPEMSALRENLAKKFLIDSKVMPWDELYLSSKIAPSLNTKVDMSNFYTVIKEFFSKFRIDISKFNITYDIFPRANKSEWGYNFPIATGVDSRILANVKNQYNEYNVLLHESGHAVHSFLLHPNEMILNDGVSGIISEGIANLFGSFIYEEIFYRNFLGGNSSIKEEFKMLKEFSKINSLRAIGPILFDQGLYKNDINSLGDINALAFNTQKELLDEDPIGEEYPWGFRIHHTTHPIYLHNYFMGDVTCEMLKGVFCKKYNCSSIIDNPQQFSEFLITTVINPSGLYKYPDLFKRISGENFSLKWI